jgi:AcrR family transcriptional regulator
MTGSDLSRPRRRGRPAGAPPNKAAILAAARQAFVEHGYDATIRDIAARAGVDPALVHHYFGTKDRLLLAAIQAGESGALSIDDAIPKLLEGDPDQLGVRVITAMFAAYETAFYRAAWGSLVGLLRIASADADAAAMLRQGLMGGGLSRLVEALHVPRPEVRTALAGSELFGLGMARYVIRIEPIASAPVEAVAGWYGPTLQRYLTGPLE